ncbi:type II toxin-antitoxin system VapC family toxin [Luteimonas sp. 8-5]|uniref:type II toxin-antitoxin system VapC family toxin n=1 Tax=Luteimonas sp. 8-5 TaxID=3039387 RepID=UPI002436A1C3|nr:type II toxin-antitoxin system VapC family toxin [Luteimonas sp. 8-5]MDG6347996.1 type II toxin-antitoxin system VapC family toxin [Luteimonas sp. 8-5]
MIAVDTPILFDILIGDARHAEASETCVGEALARDEVVVCAAVVAEVQAMLDTSEDLMDILSSVGIRFEPMTESAAMRAGHMNKRYRSRGGKRSERVSADFLVGAHALMQCNGLITRDPGFYRDYFKGLKLIVPAVPAG